MSKCRPFTRYVKTVNGENGTKLTSALSKQTQSPVAGSGEANSPSQTPGAGGPLTDEIYTQDGDYIKDVEVNDLRNRYTLTKGSTQKMVNTRSLHRPH